MKKKHFVYSSVLFLVVTILVSVLLVNQWRETKELHVLIKNENMNQMDRIANHSRVLILHLEEIRKNEEISPEIHLLIQEAYESSVVLDDLIHRSYNGMINFYNNDGFLFLYQDIAKFLEELGNKAIVHDEELKKLDLYIDNAKKILAMDLTIRYMFYVEGDIEDFITNYEIVDLYHLREMNQYSEEFLHTRDYFSLPLEIREYFEKIYSSLSFN